MPKIYETWPGTNRFYFNYCITGPIQDCMANSYWYVCATLILILYSIFITPKLWNQVTPALPILLYLCLIGTTMLLNLTSCSDPGIIPRKPYLERVDPEKFRYLLVNEIEGRSGFCDTCKIWRPKRASHCSSCDNCVEVFDHHCPFVNNCIGKRNYRFFILFLVGVFCSIGMSILNLVVYMINLGGSSVNTTVVIIICSVVFGVIAIPMFGFLIFHIYLSVTGKTTREIIKKIQVEEKPDNQWCNVDEPLINLFEQISDSEKTRLITQLQELKTKL